jgi:hypothetical protein
MVAMAFMVPATSVSFASPVAAAGARDALPVTMFLALIICALMVSEAREFPRRFPRARFAYLLNATDSASLDGVRPSVYRLSASDGSTDDIGGHGRSDFQLQ